MQQQLGTPSNVPSSFSARVDRSGRIVIPVELRERLHFQPGDELVIREVNGMLSVQSYDQVLADAQAYFGRVAPPEVSLVEELLAERRHEVEREAAREAGVDE